MSLTAMVKESICRYTTDKRKGTKKKTNGFNYIISYKLIK